MLRTRYRLKKSFKFEACPKNWQRQAVWPASSRPTPTRSEQISKLEHIFSRQHVRVTQRPQVREKENQQQSDFPNALLAQKTQGHHQKVG